MDVFTLVHTVWFLCAFVCIGSFAVLLVSVKYYFYLIVLLAWLLLKLWNGFLKRAA